MSIFSKQQGQVLVETMVALGVVTIALLGMLSLLSSSIGVNRVISDQYIAAYLASEGIEVVKNIIDTNVVQGRAYNNDLLDCVTGCMFQYNSIIPITSPSIQIRFDSSSGLYSYDSGSPTGFSRNVVIQFGESADELVVTSSVTWVSRGNVDRQIDLEDHFYNWR